MATPGASSAFDAFLSYHSGDAEWVAALKAALESRGVRVWIDSEQLRPGNLFPGALAGAIQSISCVVLVLSRGPIASAWVEEEYSLALTHRRQVVPVLIDDVELWQRESRHGRVRRGPIRTVPLTQRRSEALYTGYPLSSAEGERRV